MAAFSSKEYEWSLEDMEKELKRLTKEEQEQLNEFKNIARLISVMKNDIKSGNVEGVLEKEKILKYKYKKFLKELNDLKDIAKDSIRRHG